MNLSVVSSIGEVTLPVMSERLNRPAPVLKADNRISTGTPVPLGSFTGWIEKPVLLGLTFSKRVLCATVPAMRSAFGSTRMFVVVDDAVIGNMLAARYTPSRLTPSVGK